MILDEPAREEAHREMRNSHSKQEEREGVSCPAVVYGGSRTQCAVSLRKAKTSSLLSHETRRKRGQY